MAIILPSLVHNLKNPMWKLVGQTFTKPVTELPKNYCV